MPILPSEYIQRVATNISNLGSRQARGLLRREGFDHVGSGAESHVFSLPNKRWWQVWKGEVPESKVLFAVDHSKEVLACNAKKTFYI
ncbi:MAG: hypothetical protein O2840_03415, partial [bacterium]|nr:hypothetical protein [bacterium]